MKHSWNYHLDGFSTSHRPAHLLRHPFTGQGSNYETPPVAPWGHTKKCPHCVRLSYEPQTHHLWNTQTNKEKTCSACIFMTKIYQKASSSNRPTQLQYCFFCSTFSGWVVAPLQSQQARCQPSETQQLGSLSKVASVRGRCDNPLTFPKHQERHKHFKQTPHTCTRAKSRCKLWP